LLAILIFVVPPHWIGAARGVATLSDYGWGFAAGICGGLGLALLYHALSIGKMGVVSPITAVLAAALPVILGVTIRHEHLAWLQTGGIAVALIAVVLISISHEETGEIEFATKGVKEAIASGIVLSGFYLFLGFGHPQAGLQPLLTARVASIGLLLLIGIAARSSIVPQNRTLPLITLGGTIDMAANAFYIFAVEKGFLSIAAVLTSLYPASTVFLARIVLHERLQLVQKIGVALALAGVALIAA
jgi:drug/metabolite transporter (DMT)-like permease